MVRANLVEFGWILPRVDSAKFKRIFVEADSTEYVWISMKHDLVNFGRIIPNFGQGRHGRICPNLDQDWLSKISVDINLTRFGWGQLSLNGQISTRVDLAEYGQILVKVYSTKFQLGLTRLNWSVAADSVIYSQILSKAVSTKFCRIQSNFVQGRLRQIWSNLG